MDKAVTLDELERARRDSHQLLERADDAALYLPSNGTRWNNRQLLLHMLLGYLSERHWGTGSPDAACQGDQGRPRA